MPINKKMLGALRKVMYPDNKPLKDNYKRERKVVEITHPHRLIPYYRMWNNQVVSNGHEVPVKIFFPVKAEDNARMLVFFHGGGFVTGNTDTYSKTCSRMANITKSIVLSVEYGLAPEHPFPEGLEDCYAVVKALSESVLGEEIILIGDSAGGNLTASVSLLAKERGEFKVNKQILLYPALNSDFSDNSPYKSVVENGSDYLLTQKRMVEYMDLYVPNKEDLTNPHVAPILAKDFSDMPDTLIITAEFDLLRDEAEDYGRKLKEAGNNVTVHRISNAVHGFITLMPVFSEVREAYDCINEFLNRENNS